MISVLEVLAQQALSRGNSLDRCVSLTEVTEFDCRGLTLESLWVLAIRK
jgi:hypothetical protein